MSYTGDNVLHSQPSILHSIGLSLLCVLLSGCSTLGLSLYPSNSTLTREAEAVLDASRIPAGLPRENAKSILPPHAIEPGDALLIEPVNLERDLRLPADQVVLADGTVDLGPYGRVVVAGQSLEQAESLIEQQIAYQLQQQRQSCKQFASDEDRSVIDSDTLPANCDAIAINVRMLEPVHRYYVLGEVNAPGAYPLSGYETVLDAIVTAGGLTSSSNPCKILLARPTDPCNCRVTLPVCYREIVQLGNTSSNYQLQPGDRIFVSSRSCLDELMFWRASRTCSRCEGCNRACQNPPLVTAQPMPAAINTMIPPGSVGWMRLSNDPLRPDDLVEPDQYEPTNPATSSREPTLQDYLVPDASESLPEPGTPNRSPSIESEVDGELNFDGSL
ncbi:MAG: polysaccharide biosynthesis/export family protein [Rhodopirellula sp. JB053]